MVEQDRLLKERKKKNKYKDMIQDRNIHLKRYKAILNNEKKSYFKRKKSYLKILLRPNLDVMVNFTWKETKSFTFLLRKLGTINVFPSP